MTKPLDQVKSELAEKYPLNKYPVFTAATESSDMQLLRENLSQAVKFGFDACLNHLASAGVSGAKRLSVLFYKGEGGACELSSYGEPDSVEMIELLPVAAQLSKQAERIAELEKQLAEAEKVVRFYAKGNTLRHGYRGSDQARQYFKDKGEVNG